METAVARVKWFCHYCGTHFTAAAGQDPKRCPTYGCRRPDGFGKHARIRRT